MRRKSYLLLISLLILSLASVFPAQTGNSEVFVFDVNQEDGKLVFSNAVNVSNSPGYDNQPSFGFDGSTVLFTSVRNGNSPDIYEYSLKDKALKQITGSPDADYTPRALGRDAVTFVREGAGQLMSVWQFERATKKETPALTNKEPVAYYDWDLGGGALVWVRYAFMARYVHPGKDINWYVSDSVQPSSPQVIPGTDKFSFVYRRPDGSLWIKEFDPETKAVRPIAPISDGKIDYCWSDEGRIIMGRGSELWGFDERLKKEWVLLYDFAEFGLKDITRLAFYNNRSGTVRIAVVSNQ